MSVRGKVVDYQVVKKILRSIVPFLKGWQVWQTDRQNYDS